MTQKQLQIRVKPEPNTLRFLQQQQQEQQQQHQPQHQQQQQHPAGRESIVFSDIYDRPQGPILKNVFVMDDSALKLRQDEFDTLTKRTLTVRVGSLFGSSPLPVWSNPIQLSC